MSKKRPSALRRSAYLAPVALLAVAMLTTACGNSTPTTGSTAPAKATVKGPFGATKDAALAAEVPSAIRSKGSVSVASDATYPPIESIVPGTNNIVGLDPDLGHAIGAVLGINFNFQNVTFDKILLGLKAGQYDIGMSGFTDEKAREKVVNFVDYLQSGVSFVTKSSNPVKLPSLAVLCGMTIGTESGSIEQAEAITQSKKCTAAGKKPVKILAYSNTTQVNLALSAGRIPIQLADTIGAAYVVQQSKGKWKMQGNFGPAPFGIAIPKDSGMLKPILGALKKLMADGIYQKIVNKWGLQNAAIKAATVNHAVY